MADALKTMSTTLKKGITPIINITGIDYSGLQGFLMDTTNLSSPNGVKTQESSGVVASGDLKVSINYDPSDATHKAIITDIKAGTSDAYTVTFPDASTFIANCIVSAFDWTGQQSDDGKFEATFTLSLAGDGITDPA